MSYIANTAFEARITNNRDDILSHIAGKYQVTSPATADADCSAGLLCVRASLAPNEGFDNPSGTRVYNENTWIMNAAASTVTADDVIYACDTYDTQLVTAPGGQNYYVGLETLGLGVPAGRFGNFTRIDFDNQSVYRFGIGNLSAAISTNTYFTISAGLLVPAASAPTDTGAIYFKLHGTGKFVKGNSQAFTYYDVVACKVSTYTP